LEKFLTREVDWARSQGEWRRQRSTYLEPQEKGHLSGLLPRSVGWRLGSQPAEERCGGRRQAGKSNRGKVTASPLRGGSCSGSGRWALRMCESVEAQGTRSPPLRNNDPAKGLRACLVGGLTKSLPETCLEVVWSCILNNEAVSPSKKNNEAVSWLGEHLAESLAWLWL
jgi:hypothetical protein